MIFSDKTIKEYIQQGKILILPEFDFTNIRPVGIRLHLGKELLIPAENQIIDLEGKYEIRHKKISLTEKGYTLKPGDFVLGTTLEKFQVQRDIVCHIDGRSTIARLGLAIHCTSSIADGNFDEPRTVVLEIKNNGPHALILKPKIAVAMLTFTKLTSPIEQNSQNQYRGQDGVRPPKLKLQKE